MREKCAALFIRCSDEDAEKIRDAARAERRTVSGYILNAVISRMDAREKMLQQTRQGAIRSGKERRKVVRSGPDRRARDRRSWGQASKTSH